MADFDKQSSIVQPRVEHAVILAAGYGSRLSTRTRAKPLAKIGEATLIEIAIRQALGASVDHVAVVIGHEADLVAEHLDEIRAFCLIEISTVRLNDWSKPNGWSVIAGARSVSSPFLLMMADHVFADGLLAKLAYQSLGEDDVVLATDRPDNPLLDPDDATWVARKQGDKIAAIGKDISAYDAVDCGAFLANHALPSAIEEAIAHGKPGSLSDGMQVLAGRERARTMDIGGAWWIDVDDPRAHDLAIAQAPDHIGWLKQKVPVVADANR